MDFYDFFDYYFKAIAAQAKPIRRDAINDYPINTVNTPDCGLETAIWKGETGTIIIVARYNTEEEALEGHENWVSACSLNPTKAWSVQFNKYIEL